MDVSGLSASSSCGCTYTDYLSLQEQEQQFDSWFNGLNEWANRNGRDVGNLEDWDLDAYYTILYNATGSNVYQQAVQSYYWITAKEEVGALDPVIEFAAKPWPTISGLLRSSIQAARNAYGYYAPGYYSPPGYTPGFAGLFHQCHGGDASGDQLE